MANLGSPTEFRKAFVSCFVSRQMVKVQLCDEDAQDSFGCCKGGLEKAGWCLLSRAAPPGGSPAGQEGLGRFHLWQCLL